MTVPQPTPEAMRAAMQAMLAVGIDTSGTAPLTVERIAHAIDAFAAERVAAEREACAIAMCFMCAAGLPTKRQGYIYVHADDDGVAKCHASVIRARGKERPNGKEDA